jgi:hypothetical protein
MSNRRKKWGIIEFSMLVAFLVFWSAQGASILPGWWVLNASMNSTNTLLGANWEGVPYGTFAFGTHGTKTVGSANLIIQVMSSITNTGGSSSLQVVGAQFQTVTPAQLYFDGPTDYYFLTQDATLPSTGTVTVDSFPSGASSGHFHASLTLEWDLYDGSFGGPIIFTNSTPLTISGVLWSSNAPSGALLLTNINYRLNGSDTAQDFWPGTFVTNGITNHPETVLRDLSGLSGPEWLQHPEAKSLEVAMSSMIFTDPSDQRIQFNVIDTILPTVTATRAGDDLIVSWRPTGGRLQSAASLAGVWTTIGSGNPTRLSIAATNAFLRVAVP